MSPGNPPEVDPKTGRVKLTVLGNWLKWPLLKWTLTLLGLVLWYVILRVPAWLLLSRRPDKPQARALSRSRKPVLCAA